jgi:hypothetical protein
MMVSAMLSAMPFDAMAHSVLPLDPFVGFAILIAVTALSAIAVLFAGLAARPRRGGPPRRPWPPVHPTPWAVNGFHLKPQRSRA